MQIQTHACLNVRRDLALAVTEKQSVERQIQVRVQIQLATDTVVGVQPEGVLQYSAGKCLTAPLVAVECRIGGSNR